MKNQFVNENKDITNKIIIIIKGEWLTEWSD